MKSRLLGVVCASFIVSYSSFSLAASFTPLGFLNSGETATAIDVSADGSKVVGTARAVVPPLISTPFIWTAASGMQSLGSISGIEFAGTATAISANGSVVVGQSGDLAYRWTATTGVSTLGSFPSGITSIARGISDDGNVVVGFANVPESGPEGFRWTPATSMVGLGASSLAHGVSGDGNVVVGEVGECCAAYWTEDGGWTDLAVNFQFTSATLASADGSVILGNQNLPGLSDSDAFRWTMDAGVTFLLDDGADGSLGSEVFDVTPNGRTAVGYRSTSILPFQREAAMWDEANTIHLIKDILTAEGIDLTGWELRVTTGISADGSIIVGTGVNPDGVQESWIAQIAPASPYTLKCSTDSNVDGADPDCMGGNFSSELWVYLWPEDNVDTVDFYLDGAFNNTERFVPYELDARAETVLSPGSHTVRAVANLAGGGTEEIIATFTIDAAAYTLLCSSDSVVDGNDVACDGGDFNSLSHPAGIWVYLWPEDGSVIDYVDYFLGGTFERRENFVPWELFRGEPLAVPASQTNYVVTTDIGLFSGETQSGPAAVFNFEP